MAVKRYDGSAWQTVAGLGAQGPAATSSSIATWVKTASGGETSVSGNDDNSQPLSYTVGQELVFINGVLQKRGDDYTATTGNSITGLTALTAGDIVSVWTVNAFSVSNAISNTIVDAKGDILVGTGADTPGRLAVGTNDYVLTADSTTGTGLKWAAIPASSGPAFKATGTTNQALAGSTWVKAQLGTETFDTDNCYDNATNYRFTPNKAGYYSFQTAARITHGDASAYYQYGIYKNGTLENLLIIVTAQTSGSTYAASNLIYFNGTTDYAEFYVYTQATASQNLDRSNTFFSGVWIRS